jgi:hypothetical protein
MATLPKVKNFQDLAALSGGLRALRSAVLKVERRARGPRFCRRVCWAEFRPRLLRLVGWGAPRRSPPLLQTVDAFDLAERSLYALLPECGPDCRCTWKRPPTRIKR